MAAVLFVNERCGYFGGVEQNIADTAAGLRERGHRCYLAYGMPTDRETAAYQAFFDGCVPCRELWAGSHTPDSRPFADILDAVSPDAVYIHKTPEVGFCAPFFSRLRIVRMIHDHDLCCPRRHKYFLTNGRICHHRADWRCYLDLAFLERDRSSWPGLRWAGIRPKRREMERNRRIGGLLVGSRFMREELLQNGFRADRVHILPPVVRFEDITPAPVPDEPHILYVGQLIRGKGVDLLLRALRQIACRFTATIAGTGHAAEALRAQCEASGLSERVRFAGWVPHRALGACYAAARVVAVPSRWPEPFGMIGLEAMRHARPVVGFAVGGIPDWLAHEETGLLVPEQDIAGLARALERLLTDHALASAYGRAGYERARTMFGFDAYLDRLEGFLGITH
jgi:glycosyltransferase involved in cell wall biosynthesis